MRLKEMLWTARVLGLGHLRTLARARTMGPARIGRGYYATRVISTLFNVGFFDELAAKDSVTVEAYAATRNLDPAILGALCEYLFALKVLRKQGGAYALDVNGWTLVSVLRGMFDSAYGYEDVFHFLEPMLKREMKYGVDVHRKSDYVASASGAAGKLFTFPLVIDLIRQKGYRRVLDLACGDATFLIDLCRKNSTVLGYGLDIAPDAVENGRRKIQAENLGHRIHLFTGDVFQIDKVSGELPDVDAVTSFYGFQEFLASGKDRLLWLLREYRTRFPGVRFVVCEIPRYSAEELRSRPGALLEYQLFHSLTHQKLATRDEWMDLWQEADVGRVEERYLDFARTVIYELSW